MSSSVSVPQPSSSAIGMDISADTWIEVRDADGRKLFSRMAKEGEQLSLEGPSPLQVRIGNVSGVQLRYKGQPVDMSAYTRSNVARFELK
jgi:cytoskeleton protein RodZ